MDEGLTYQGSDTINMQSKGTLVFHCYQILERWYITNQTTILILINFSALHEIVNIATGIPFKQKLLLNVVEGPEEKHVVEITSGSSGDVGPEFVP
jgi:hypothetical protein